MKKLGIYLVIFGIGSFLLPILGLQFKIFMIFGEAAPVIGVIMVVAGILLIVGAAISENKRVHNFAGKTGDTGTPSPAMAQGASRGLKCYACKANISETDTVCPKCQTPL